MTSAGATSERAAPDLAASEAHLRLAFDSAPIAMSLIGLSPDTVGSYLRANTAFARMLGYHPDEIPSLDADELSLPGDAERDLVRFESIVNGTATSVEFEKRYRHKDGHIVLAWLTSSVALGPTGAPLCLISHAVEIMDRRREQSELQRLAVTDALTGLANATLLRDRLDQALARLHRDQSYGALMHLDVDRFTAINSSRGSHLGDALLVEMAGRIEAVSRADSTVARLGGDEFVVLIEGLASPDDVHGVATRLLDALRRPYLIPGTGEALVATVSMGVAVITRADRSPVDLHHEADLAMHRAKDAGRDQYALFDDALRARVIARTGAELLLRRALAEDLLLPHFQPILDVAAGRLVSVEALARIHDPLRGVITPDQFLEVAEESGLIAEVDGRMIDRAIAQLARWRRDGVALRRVSVTVSTRSLTDPGFVERVEKAARWYDVGGAELRIELSEHSVLSTSPTVHASISRLAGLGFHVGLDNFATGYSALAHLQRYPLAFLKVDRSFIARLGNSRRDDAVVAALIDLAHAHEALAVAQGVETVDQLETLRAMGCDRAQGDLLGPALPPGELAAIVAADPRW